MKNLIFIIFLLSLISCQNETKTLTINGEKIAYHNDGNFKHFYKSGEIKYSGVITDGKLSNNDTLFYYYKNGAVKEKGLLQDGLKKGWWMFYDSLGNIKLKVDNKMFGSLEYANQLICYKNNQIDSTKGWFSDISVCNLNNVKKNISIKYFSEDQKNRTILYAIIDTIESDFKTSYDTIYSRDDKTINFFIFPKDTTKTDNLKLKGKIIEEYWGGIKKLEGDNVEMTLSSKTSLFNMEISKNTKKCKPSDLPPSNLYYKKHYK